MVQRYVSCMVAEDKAYHIRRLEHGETMGVFREDAASLCGQSVSEDSDLPIEQVHCVECKRLQKMLRLLR